MGMILTKNAQPDAESLLVRLQCLRLLNCLAIGGYFQCCRTER